MRINLMSDLHLEFGDLELPGGDVLILAGDIMTARHTRPHQDWPKETILKYNRFKRFCDVELAKYNHVIYVMGNHEHYGNKFTHTEEMLSTFLPENTFLLENGVLTIEDVKFFGATLWTDLNKGNPIAVRAASDSMNDYRAIKHYSKHPYERGNLIVTDTMNKHKESVKHLKSFLEANQNIKTVVVTHHAPSHASVHPEYIGDILNYAYASDLSELILDNPQIKAWCHGHIHYVNDYMIGETRILANPRGYAGHEHTGGFDVNFSFDV